MRLRSDVIYNYRAVSLFSLCHMSKGEKEEAVSSFKRGDTLCLDVSVDSLDIIAARTDS